MTGKAKVYKYKDKLYSDRELDCENYGGDLDDLVWELKFYGLAEEETCYYSTHSDFKERYGDIAEFLEEEKENLDIEEVEL